MGASAPGASGNKASEIDRTKDVSYETIKIKTLQESEYAHTEEEFKSKTSIETYKTGFNSQLTGIRNLFSADENFKNKVLQRVENYKNMSDDEFKKIFDSTKYQKHLDNMENILSKLPHVKGEEMKFVVSEDLIFSISPFKISSILFKYSLAF